LRHTQMAQHDRAHSVPLSGQVHRVGGLGRTWHESLEILGAGPRAPVGALGRSWALLGALGRSLKIARFPGAGLSGVLFRPRPTGIIATVRNEPAPRSPSNALPPRPVRATVRLALAPRTAHRRVASAHGPRAAESI